MRMQQDINKHSTNTPKKVLLSLHGFHSSPASLKAQQMQEYLAVHHPDILFLCPQLPVLPKDMWALISDIFKQYQHSEIAVMGSSLGGFLATKVEETYQGCDRSSGNPDSGGTR